MTPRAPSLDAPATPGTTDTGGLLAEVERAITRMMRQATRPAFYRALMAAAGTQLDRAEYAVMLRIAEGAPLRVTQLADVLGIDISTVSRQVRELEKGGLVERSGDPDDQRASQLRLTDEGQHVLNRVLAARQESMRNLLDGWSREDQVRLTRLVGRLADRMEMVGQ